MLINKTDELLIQRCVDDELSPPEMRALLQRLDRLDSGWKKLAFELLEDRGMRKAFRSPGHQPFAATQGGESMDSVGQRAAMRPIVAPSMNRSAIRHWWSHPVTSLTLCAAIAFVGGMLIPDLDKDRTAGAVATDSNRTSPPNAVFPRAQNADAGPADSYRVQMQPGGQSFDIPVYSGLHDLARSDRNHPLFSEQIEGAHGSGPEFQWLIVPAGEKRSVLFPVSENTLDDLQ